jgi:hypothetical protein
VARTAITPTTVTPAGVDPFPSSGDATNGHTFPWAATRLLAVRNGGGSSLTVTVRANYTVDGLVLPDRTVTVAAGASRIIDTRGAAYQQTDGGVYVDLSSATSVVLGVLDIARG